MKRKRITRFKNARGIKILRCCASCAHKEVDGDGRRICHALMLIVPNNLKCRKWALKKAYLSAGNGGGKVKCLEYLMYVRDKRLVEQDLIEQGVITLAQQMTCRELRRRFNKETGKGIYAIK